MKLQRSWITGYPNHYYLQILKNIKVLGSLRAELTILEILDINIILRQIHWYPYSKMGILPQASVYIRWCPLTSVDIRWDPFAQLKKTMVAFEMIPICKPFWAPFSAESTPTFATEGSFCSIFRPVQKISSASLAVSQNCTFVQYLRNNSAFSIQHWWSASPLARGQSVIV